MFYNKQKTGFTLLELAIALIIIGILMGMAFKGRTMLRTSQLRSQIATVAAIRAAVVNFETQFNRLPGDATAAGIISTTQSVAARNELIAAGLLTPRDLTVTFEQRNLHWHFVRCFPTATGYTTVNNVLIDNNNTVKGNVCLTLSPSDVAPAFTFGNITPLAIISAYELYADDSNMNTGSGRGATNAGAIDLATLRTNLDSAGVYANGYFILVR